MILYNINQNKEVSKTVITPYQVMTETHAASLQGAIAAEVEGRRLIDLSCPISSDTPFKVIHEQDPDALPVIRHSTAHLLAQAVKQLFPNVKMAIGPVIEDGFYYDFSFDRPFVPEDLVQIEERMKQLARKGYAIRRSFVSKQQAMALFRELKEEYKLQILKDLPDNEEISLYHQGEFIDLCRGPHVPNTRCLKVFKLTRVAGAYWRGKSSNAVLQRIYGTAWSNEKDLLTYLDRLQEAKNRDHRKLAKQLDLFHLQEEAPGSVFWHPLGWELYQIIESYIRSRLRTCGYQEIRTPQIMSRQFWEASGHWDKFFSDMFITCSEEREFAIKPMSCPGHIQVFNQGVKSHRDLPLRFSEFGVCHRNEPSGALHGLMRVRNFTQDDAHIFCTEEQVQTEVIRFMELVHDVYHDFGFRDILIRLATRPVKRLGSEAFWDKAEGALIQALMAQKLKWEQAEGEGAFYGPKLEFSLRDCLGRLWQCGTMQVDFSMPERLGASYVAEDGSRKTPVLLHRAILGSLERFIGILIEHYAGNFPAWLAPIQAVIMTITDRQIEYARKLDQKLQASGVRVKLDLRNEKISFKIREHSLAKVPYLLILGDNEEATETISVRRRGGEMLAGMSLTEFLRRVFDAVVNKI